MTFPEIEGPGDFHRGFRPILSLCSALLGVFVQQVFSLRELASVLFLPFALAWKFLMFGSSFPLEGGPMGLVALINKSNARQDTDGALTPFQP